MLKDLIKVANRLDALGLQKEADALDQIIKKVAWPWDEEPMKITRDIDIGNEETGIRYYASVKKPYQYMTSFRNRGEQKSIIYCAPGHRDNSLYTELSIDAWNEDVESLNKGEKPK